MTRGKSGLFGVVRVCSLDFFDEVCYNGKIGAILHGFSRDVIASRIALVHQGGGEKMVKLANRLFKMYTLAAVAGAACFVALAWSSTRLAIQECERADYAE